jgi:hypothetical protein
VPAANESGSRVKERERIQELRAEVLRRTMQLLHTILAPLSPTPSPPSHAPATLSEGQGAVCEMLLREGLLGKEFFSLVSTDVTHAA